jgi:hypothetical protein
MCPSDAEARRVGILFMFSEIQWRVQSTLRCTGHIPPAPGEVLQIECLRPPG